MDAGSSTSPSVLDDIRCEFESSDDELADYQEQISDRKPLSDDESNVSSTVELHEQSENIYLDTRSSAIIATLDGLNGATRWQVNRYFGECSVTCRCHPSAALT